MNQHTTAPAARIDPLLIAHHKFMAIAHRRPAPLGLDPSPDAMERRACEVEEIMLAMKDYALAMVEDSASVMSLPTDLRSGIIAAFDDMAGDVRGALNIAVEEAREESQVVRRIG